MDQWLTSVKPMADLPLLLPLIEARKEAGGEGRRYFIHNVSPSEAEVYLYDDIGAWGITATDFVKELQSVKADTITLRINSNGGDVFEAVAIYNACRRHRATVNVVIDSVAASAASFVAMAGDAVTMAPHSQMIIHDATGFAMGPASVMRKLADILDFESDNIAAIYAERAGGTIAEWRERMRTETLFSDREAVEIGLADRVEGVEEDDLENRTELDVVAEAEAPVEEAEEATTPTPPDFLQGIKQARKRQERVLYAPVSREV